MSEYPLQVRNSWGVSSVRLCAGFPTSLFMTQQDTDDKVYYYDCPLGCCIVRWNVVYKTRLIFFQAHSDLIPCMVKCPTEHRVLTVSFSGEGALWTEAYKLVKRFEFSSDNVIYAAWAETGDQFAVCSKGPKSQVGVYSVEFGPEVKLDLKLTLICPQPKEKPSDDASNGANCYDFCTFASNGNILTIYQTNDAPCEVHLFSRVGELLKKISVSPLGDPKTVMLCASSDTKGTLAVGLQQGLFEYISCTDLKTRGFFQAPGSPQICLWDKTSLLAVAYLSGALSWWDASCTMIRELKGGPGGSVVHLNWEKMGQKLWVGGIMSLDFVEIPPETTKEGKVTVKHSLETHRLSGCGVAESAFGYVASGDLAGNILIWKNGMIDPVYKSTIPDMVRCVDWFDKNLMIGTLAGNLYLWEFTEGNSDGNRTNQWFCPEMCFVADGGITSVTYLQQQNLIVLGTTTGTVFLLVFKDSKCHKKASFVVHHEKGGKKMEIWSLCLSPDQELLATASEDQTCCITKLATGQTIHTLIGHTMAVTSVDWKHLSSSALILATCSDDRTVRVYDGSNFNLQFTFNTKNIYGWHTLTYLSINPVTDTLVCCTQNGYVVAWNLDTRTRLLQKRVHCGSVEGLGWGPNYEHFNTIGSDGVVNNFVLNHHASGQTLPLLSVL